MIYYMMMLVVGGEVEDTFLCLRITCVLVFLWGQQRRGQCRVEPNSVAGPRRCEVRVSKNEYGNEPH